MKKHFNQKGFTLIEALVALAIFSIGFLAVAAMQTGALFSTTESRKMTESVEIATSHVELLRNLPFYPDFGSASGNDKFDEPGDLAEGVHEVSPVPGYPVDYTVRWTVEDDMPLDFIPVTENRWVATNPEDVTISKTITVEVFETRNPGQIMTTMEFVKIWDRE